ncbi:surface-adhesin E family protein [Caulobacter sp. KR2-114]|uniref:surface-adhesin E family protein n=1 Tax=Caulobacter sp. KR2-114 TaxID=3400912 RepID=UPI003C10FCEE
MGFRVAWAAMVVGLALSVGAVAPSASAANYVVATGAVPGPGADYWDADSLTRQGAVAQISTLSLMYGPAFGGETYGWLEHWSVNCDWGWMARVGDAEKVAPDGSTQPVAEDSTGQRAFPWSEHVTWIAAQACAAPSPHGGGQHTIAAAIRTMEAQMRRRGGDLPPISLPTPPPVGLPAWDASPRLSVVARNDGAIQYLDWSQSRREGASVSAWTITLLPRSASSGLSPTVRLSHNTYDCSARTVRVEAFADYSAQAEHGVSGGPAPARPASANPLTALALAAACGAEPPTDTYGDLTALVQATYPPR